MIEGKLTICIGARKHRVNKLSNEEEKDRKALSSFRLKTTKGMNTAFDAQLLQQ